MMKTRNLFILKGKQSDVDSVLEMLQFKGLTQLPSSINVTTQIISNEFENNKSVICSYAPENFANIAIEVNVVNSSKNNFDEDKNYINIATGSIPQQFETIVNKYNLDIGDHKSNSSGLDGAPKSCDCPYCIYINNNHIDKELDNINRTV